MADYTTAPRSAGLFTLNAFCKWAGIGRTKAYEELATGTLRACKLGARTMVRIEDAIAWRDALPTAVFR